MSGISYPPPSENLPIFDSSVFQPTETAIDSNTGLQYFLSYPNAQGTENLQAINVNGLANFNTTLKANSDIITTSSSYPTITTDITQGQYYLNMSSNSTNADGGVLKLTNTNTTASASLGTTLNGGLNINRGITIGNNNTGNGYVVSMASDQTILNQLDISGNVSISATQAYPQTSNTQQLATIAYVNSGSGSALLATDNTWTGTNDFGNNTSFGNILQGNGTAIINFPPTLPNIPSASTSGFGICWNGSGGGGETDFISYGQGAGDIGGFDFYASNSTIAPTQIAQFRGTSINFNLTPTQPVLTYPITTNLNRSATIGYVNGLLGGTNNWTGTNSFNTNTTGTTQSLGDNTTKLATTEFVQSAVGGSSILGSNNTWSGINTFNNTIFSPNVSPSTDSSTKVANTSFVQSAITTNNSSFLSTAHTWSGQQTFNNTLTSVKSLAIGSSGSGGQKLYTYSTGGQIFNSYADNYSIGAPYDATPYMIYQTPAFTPTNASAGFVFQVYNGSVLVPMMTINLGGFSSTNATLTASSNALTFEADSSVQNSAFTDQLKSNISPILNSTSSSNLVINQQLQLTDGAITATFGPGGLSTNNPTGLSVASLVNFNQNDLTNVATISNNNTDLNISSGGDNVNITGGSSIVLNATSEVNINATDNGVNISSTNNDVNLEATNGGIGVFGFVYNQNMTGNINSTADQDVNITATNGYLNLTATANNITLNTSAEITLNNGTGVRSVGGNFIGNLTGNADTATTATTATNATNATNIQVNNTSANLTHYLSFVDSNTTGLKSLQSTNGLNFNPNTNTLSTTTFIGSLTGSCSTTGLVYISSGTLAITGSASATNIPMTSIFNANYKNYRVVLAPTTQLSFGAYPTYSLTAFSGTGTLPTIASLYGNELTSNSPSAIAVVYTAGATIASTPLAFAVSQSVNHQTIFEIENVGFANTQPNQIGIKCKSFYSNPGVSGYSDRNILCASVSGATITGLTIQQSSISVGNNMTIGWTIYGYK